MTIYNFNLGIGWASSGVEYAQAYRANIFRKSNQQAKFIFTNMFRENIEPLTKKIGFEDDEIIWLYQYFTDVKTSPTTYNTAQLEATFAEEPTNVDRNDQYVLYTFESSNSTIKAIFDERGDEDSVYKTETRIAGKLVQQDYYSYVRTHSEYFKPFENTFNVYQRRYFNENGSVAYEEMINGQQSLFIFKDRTIYSFESLVEYFVDCLELTNKDIIIMDRSTKIGPSLLKSRGNAKLGVVIHAEHYNEARTNDDIVLWNNFYEYQFSNVDSIDFFVTATDIQEKILEDQFRKYHLGDIKVYSIPVGSIDQLLEGDNRKKHAIVTASRLASEKHLDWLVKAVAIAHQTIDDVSLDIYGHGNQEGIIRTAINETNSEEYIRLMGHHDLTNIYRQYDAYAATSPSEGFGLSLLEAIGSGLPMIVYDVPYGQQAFVKEGINGYLAEYSKNDDEKNIEVIAKNIVKMMSSDERMAEMSKNSYKIAEDYLTSKIQDKWLRLEEEQIND